MQPAQEPPKPPPPKATKETGSVITEGGQLFSQKQQKEELAQLLKTSTPIVVVKPSNSVLRRGLDNIVKTFQEFRLSEPIIVKDAQVGQYFNDLFVVELS